MSYPTINYITNLTPKILIFRLYRQYVTILLLLFVNTFVPAQSIHTSDKNLIFPVSSVPEIDSLQTSITKYFQEKTLAELEQYNYKTRAQWLKFLPSPGWNFILNSPVISYNFSDVANAVNYKYIRKATVNAIIQANQVELNSTWYEIVLLRETLTSKINAYNATFDLLSLHTAKFEIVEKGYNKNEITPSDFLNAKLSLASFTNSLQKDFSALVQLRNELLIKSKKGDAIPLFDKLLYSSLKSSH